jgi:hypothetical protein
MKLSVRPSSGRRASLAEVSAVGSRQVGISTLLALVVWLGSSPAALAQDSTEIFREVSVGNLSAAGGDAAELQGPSVVRSRYVEVDLGRILEPDAPGPRPSRARGESRKRLTFNLFADAVQEFEQDRAEYSADGLSYAWYGRPLAEGAGQALLVVQDGNVAGSVQTASGEFYRIRSVNSRVHVIRQVTYQGAPPVEDAVPVPDSEVPQAAYAQQAVAQQSAATTLDVMVVYTAAARQAAGGTAGIQSEIQLAIAELTQSFTNSGVQMQARLAHSAEVSYNEQIDLSTSLARLRTTGDGYMDEIHALRDQYGADVVALLVNGPGSNGGTVGTGYIMQTVGSYFSAYAFSVTEVNFATGPSYALLHEIGHNLGCAHDRANSGSAGAYPYSYGYQRSTTPRFRDIMAYNCSGVNCPTINYWSNPNVNYQGYPTGVSSSASNSADNSQSLNNTRATAAAWRSGGSSGGGSGGGGGGGAANVAPTVVSMTPSSGSGSSQAFTTTFSDANGANNLVYGYWLFHNSISWAGSCGVRYDRVNNKLELINEEGSWWQAGFAPGASGTLANSRCSINTSSASASASGNTLSVSFTVAFNSSFSGAKTAFLNVSDSAGALAGWQAKASWTVTAGSGGGSAPVSPTIQSLTPTSGSGSAQAFTTKLADGNGASDLVYGYWLIHTSQAWPGSCGVLYDRRTNQLSLISEDGSAWQAGITAGSGALSNSRCSVNGSSVSASASGNTLTVSFTLNFSSSFGGAKTVWLNATDTAGAQSGWQAKGIWTVPGGGGSAPAPPAIQSFLPASGSGASQAFTTTLTDANGASDLVYGYWLVNTSISWAGSCGVRYDRTKNQLALITEDGSWWQAGITPGSGSLSNSRCSLNGSSVSANASGNALTVSFTLNFNSSFSGAKTVWLNVMDAGGALSGWLPKGNWTVSGSAAPASAPPAIQAFTPTSGSGSSQNFSTTLSDANGAADLVYGYWLINTSQSWAGSCGVLYDRGTNQLSLITEDGSAWQAGISPGSGSLSNSRCSVNGSSISASASGNTLTVSFAVNFSSAFNGAKGVWLNAQDAGGAQAGWQQRGTWTVSVSGGSTPAAPTVQSITPSTGAGASREFVTTFSDANGAGDLRHLYWMFNQSYSWAGSCGVRYDRALNSLALINEEGSWWQAGITPGAAGTLSNSRCSLNVAGATVSSSGNNLTVRFALSFSGAFRGTKYVWLNAADGTGNMAGWIVGGSWLVP